MRDAEMSVAQHTLQHRLQDIPTPTLPHVKVGFSLLEKVDPARLSDVVEYVVGNFSRRSRYNPDEASTIAGIDKNIVGDMLSAVAITVGAVFDIDVTKEDFFRYAPDTLIDDAAKPLVEKVLDNIIERRTAIKGDVDRSGIANAVLPSFMRLEVETDIRLKFDGENRLVNQVPVAVIYLDTDSSEEIWFQASLVDLTGIIDKLEKSRKRLEIADSMKFHAL